MNEFNRRKDDHHGIKKLLLLVVCLLIGSILAAALIVWVYTEVDRARCEANGDETGRDTRYTFLVGCMVKLPAGKWFPREEVRQIQRN